jgi:putative tryptophan/tyrosine transport system substrate-binding protein
MITVGEGFISSLARPGGNVTGFTFFEYAMFGKSLELLKKGCARSHARRLHLQS